MIDIRYIRTSTLLIRWGERYILTDPWFAMQMRGLPVFVRPCVSPKKLPPLHLVLVSHLHPDHFDRSAMRRLSQPCGTLVGPPGLQKAAAGAKCDEMVELMNMQTYESDGFKVTAFVVEHSGYENGYVVEHEGESIVFAGDAKYTGVFSQIGKMVRPNVAILPVGGTEIIGRRIVMNPADALRAGLDLGAKTIVPSHTGGEWMSVPPLSRHPGRAEHLIYEAENTPGAPTIAALQPGESARILPSGKVARIDWNEEG